jgi:hypothetical protein
MIGGATASGLATPSSISFKMETYHSEKQSALQMGLSGNYLGFEGSASGSIDKKQSETTVTAQFYQKMFEVVVEAPQSPVIFSARILPKPGCSSRSARGASVRITCRSMCPISSMDA